MVGLEYMIVVKILIFGIRRKIMSSFNIEDAGFTLGVNVKITKRDRMTGQILEERKGHNRCLKTQLMRTC